MKPLRFFVLTGLMFFMAMTCAKAQDIKANIRAAYDNLNKRDYAAFTKLVTPDFTEYAAGPEPIKTPQAAIEAYKMYFTAFPDLKFQIQDIAGGENGRYYLKVLITGTNTGSFMMLPPTGKKFSHTDVDIIELNPKGLATSHWSANPNGILSAVGYGSMANPSTQVVLQAYDKFSKGDVPGLMALCTDDVVFDVQDNVLTATPKMYKGKAQAAEFFKDLGAQNQYTVFQPWRFIADGDDVMILVHAEFKHMPDGKVYNTNYVHHFTVVNGKVAAFKGVADIQKPELNQLAEANIKALFSLMDAAQTEKFSMYCSKDFMISNPFVLQPSPIAAFQGILQTQKTAFPDMKHEIVSMISNGHYVTTNGIFKGTNTGPMMGNPATGKKVSIPFLVLDEVDDAGKIKNRIVQFDSKAFDTQLMGVVK